MSALFDLADVDPTWDAQVLDLARTEYAKAPPVAPFSRTPLSFDLAGRFGLSSYVRAWRTAYTILDR